MSKVLFIIAQFFVFSCICQSKDTVSSGGKVEKITAGQLKDTIYKKVVDSISTDSTLVILKDVQPKTQIVQKAQIWDDDQVAFLNTIEKVLFFKVKVTEIGSRKLELSTTLNAEDKNRLIELLMDSGSYSPSEMIETAKKFQPQYQMLLESNDEKLTLMFAVEEQEMIIANLYSRERYGITQKVIDFIETIKQEEK